MTTEQKEFSQTWRSALLGVELEDVEPGVTFYEDNDPRIRLVTDRWGDEVIIIGSADPVAFNNTLPNGKKEISPRLVGLRLRDGAVLYYDEKSIDQAEYPEYVHQPYQHPHYNEDNRRNRRHSHKRSSSKHGRSR